MEKMPETIKTYWEHSKYHEDLLQNYRNFHLTFQTIMLGVGSAISVFIFDKKEITFNVWFSMALLFSLCILSFLFLNGMKKTIKTREQSVAYWQHNILLQESFMEASARIYTRFIILSKTPKASEEEILLKMEQFKIGGEGKTRSIIDSLLFESFWFIWTVFVIAVFIYIIVRINTVPA